MINADDAMVMCVVLVGYVGRRGGEGGGVGQSLTLSALVHSQKKKLVLNRKLTRKVSGWLNSQLIPQLQLLTRCCSRGASLQG